MVKANGTDGSSLAVAGKTEEVPKDMPVVEEGKDQGQLDAVIISWCAHSFVATFHGHLYKIVS